MLSDEELATLARQAGELTGEAFPSANSAWLCKYTELLWSRAQFEFVVQPAVQHAIATKALVGA